MTVVNSPVDLATGVRVQLKTYTVIGLVDRDAEEPELLVAGVIEDDAAVADVGLYSGKATGTHGSVTRCGQRTSKMPRISAGHTPAVPTRAARSTIGMRQIRIFTPKASTAI
ncbi:hypothetical protein GCM10009828_092970 [Actinoplanes couchii]|uniref:Uncharacterized protein n=1 Tax=Actinoplanes couchii TaxID=403638 RepID=A0ABQ3XTT4_9ACTN|nr:hypothetical protein Aco03nite_102110 [Actinoplanes couchii]